MMRIGGSDEFAGPRITRRLAAAGTLMQVPVLDHLIVGGDGRYFSFKEGGLL